MRILILATDIYTRGGIARYTATLAEALGRLPASVDVLPLLGDAGAACAGDARRRHDSGGSFQPRVIPAQAGIQAAEASEVDSRLRGNDDQVSGNDDNGGKDCAPKGAYRVLTPTRHGGSGRLTATAKIRHALRGFWQARRRYDLVICSHLGLAPIAALIRLRYGTPYLVVAHGSEAWGRLPAIKRLAVRRARAVLAVSAYTARTMARANGIPSARMKVIYNAIPDGLVQALTTGRGDPCGRPGQPQGLPLRPMLLSVASLKREHAYKGVDTVIEALPRILAAMPEARYVVAGAGEDRARLEQIASGLGVRDRVIFAGEVSDDELANLYRACDVFVLPSRASGGEGRGEGAQGEGFGRVYVEAALAGKPVVGSIDGGAAEAVIEGRTGLLVDPRSTEQVAGSVIRLLESPDWAASLAAEGRRWALEQFTVAAMRKSLLVQFSVISSQLSVTPAGLPAVSASLQATDN